MVKYAAYRCFKGFGCCEIDCLIACVWTPQCLLLQRFTSAIKACPNIVISDFVFSHAERGCQDGCPKRYENDSGHQKEGQDPVASYNWTVAFQLLVHKTVPGAVVTCRL